MRFRAWAAVGLLISAASCAIADALSPGAPRPPRISFTLHALSRIPEAMVLARHYESLDASQRARMDDDLWRDAEFRASVRTAREERLERFVEWLMPKSEHYFPSHHGTLRGLVYLMGTCRHGVRPAAPEVSALRERLQPLKHWCCAQALEVLTHQGGGWGSKVPAMVETLAGEAGRTFPLLLELMDDEDLWIREAAKYLIDEIAGCWEPRLLPLPPPCDEESHGMRRQCIQRWRDWYALHVWLPVEEWRTERCNPTIGIGSAGLPIVARPRAPAK